MSESTQKLSQEIVEAMKPPATVAKPQPLRAGASAVETQRFHEASEAFANYLLGKAELTVEEKIYLAAGIAEWSQRGQ